MDGARRLHKEAAKGNFAVGAERLLDVGERPQRRLSAALRTAYEQPREAAMEAFKLSWDRPAVSLEPRVFCSVESVSRLYEQNHVGLSESNPQPAVLPVQGCADGRNT
jgi:hypothetical protein